MIAGFGQARDVPALLLQFNSVDARLLQVLIHAIGDAVAHALEQESYPMLRGVLDLGWDLRPDARFCRNRPGGDGTTRTA